MFPHLLSFLRNPAFLIIQQEKKIHLAWLNHGCLISTQRDAHRTSILGMMESEARENNEKCDILLLEHKILLGYMYILYR